MDKNKKFLENLLKTDTPSGSEYLGMQAFRDFCDGFICMEDKVGNVAYVVGNIDNPKHKILLSAHIDEIGLRIQYIDDNGFISVIKNGGVDLKTMLGARVRILNSKGIIHGVIGKVPIHVERRNNTEDKKIELSDIKIDCGFSSKEEALKHVSIGDCIVVDTDPMWLNEHRITGKALDDKVGVYVVGRVLDELSKVYLKDIAVYGAACTQEETTGNGAAALIKMINPDTSIDYDVTFATDDGFVEAKEWGDVKLGLGGCVVHSPDCNPRLVSKFKEIGDLTHTPYQEFSVGGGMTNTQTLKKFGFDVDTALLSIPLRNMHTQVEIADMRDLEALVKLTVETIMSLQF